MTKKLSKKLIESASQTAGPYVHIGLTPNFTGIRKVYKEDLGKNLKPASGDVITISGFVHDGAGALVRDCLLEFTQADDNGKTRLAKVGSNGFSGFNRVPIDLKKGSYKLETIKPGRVKAPDGSPQAPHITVWIVARGVNIGLHTRIYFDDEMEANKVDPVLDLVPKARRSTLIAKSTGKNKYQLDFRLQGENETVFFDV